MTKTVYFHIGTVKTGSTGLQKFCYEHREALLGADVDYIQFQPPRLDLPRWANADYLMTADFDSDVVTRYVEASPASRILISEEGLMGRPQIWQHPVFNNMRRVVILYLRNNVDLVASWASENALPYNFSQKEHSSGRGVVSVEEGISVWTDRYLSHLQNLHKAFAADPELTVRLLPFPPSNGKTLIKTLLEALELNQEAVDGLVDAASNDPFNVGHTRKFCDTSSTLADLSLQYGLPRLYSHDLVKSIYNQLHSGDQRKVVETLTKQDMTTIRNKLLSPAKALIEDYGAPPTIIDMPKAAHSNNAPYNPLDLSELKLIFFEHAIKRVVTFLQERDAALQERDAALQERDAALQERDAALQARDTALQERDAALQERDAALQARDTALQERDHTRKYPWKYIRHSWNANLKRSPRSRRGY
ncbi:hypothetical protein [Ruegeria sp. HKCCA5763]|uniref:hypothetical protein n=1 Tax=Ruegeria sp. HKCCA5763 TaxID=2682987 RepID=UPI001488A988|nr:hypothetical protein [Ruegeria sp. HKCCA5763]